MTRMLAHPRQSTPQPGWLEPLTTEVRDVLRGLRRDARFSLGVMLTVGTALAANAALVAFLSGYFWKPLPIARPMDHVEISGRDALGRTNGAWASDEAARLVEGAGGILERAYAVAERRTAVVVPGSREPQFGVGAVATREYFALLQPRLAAGRLPFDLVSAGTHTAGLILSDAGWRRLTGARPDIVGQAVRVDQAFFTVTGVMSAPVTGLEPITPDFWVLAETYEAMVGPLDHGYTVGGLLRPGVSAAGASEAMTRVVASLPAREGRRRVAALVLPRTTLMRERNDLMPLIVTLLAAFALMTLVACANLTGIYHARIAGRAGEYSIRFALGASRGRVVRQVLLEAIALAGLGGVLGCAAAWLAVDRLQGHVFSMVLQAGLTLSPVRVDLTVCLYTMALAGAVGAACALTPALAALAAQPGAAAGGVVRGGERSQRTLQRLVVAQAAVSLTLLLAAGVVVKNATRAQDVEIGYELAPLVDLGVGRLIPKRVEQILLDPRVESATTVASMPLAGYPPRISLRAADGQSRRLSYNIVDHRFFHTVRIPILRGRAFGDADGAAADRRVVVSAAAARLFWGGEDPVGRQVEVDLSDTEVPRWEKHEVVAVAGDALAGFFFQGREAPVVYLPSAVASEKTQELLVRVRGAVTSDSGLRALCRAYDPDALCQPMTLRAFFDRQQVPFTVAAEIASSLGAMTLVLACIGLYGLVSFSVVRRTREIGIRMAIGATQRTVLLDVLQGAGRRMLAGAAIGFPLAGLLLALLEWTVPMIQTFDLAVFLLVPALLVAAGVGAAFLPARRAARVDPIIALRSS